MKIKLNAVRLSFPQLFEAKTVNGEGKPAFSAAFLISPRDPQIAMINTAISSVAAEKWGAKADAILKTIRAADKTCLHSGDLKSIQALEFLQLVQPRRLLFEHLIQMGLRRDRSQRLPLLQGDPLQR